MGQDEHPGVRCRTLGALVLGLLAVAALATISGEASAIGAQVDISDENSTVLQGHSFTMQVTFGINEDTQDVHVTCSNVPPWEGNAQCPVWTTTVEFQPESDACYFENNRRVCDLDFPTAGFEAQNRDFTAAQAGEPSQSGTWTVGVESERSDGDTSKDAENQDTFEVFTSTAHTCYDGYHRRGENMAVATSGHPAGSSFSIEVMDLEQEDVVFQASRTSSGEHFTYTFSWRPPLDYPLVDDSSQFEVRVDRDGDTETETFTLRPGMARGVNLFGPDLFGQPDEFERTQSVLYEIGYVFPPRPPDCTVPPGGPFIPVTADQVREPVQGEVYKVTDLLNDDTREVIEEIPVVAFEEQREVVETPDGTFLEDWTRVAFNWTIPRDTEATRQNGSGNPEYEIHLPQTELTDGNLLEDSTSSLFDVIPYTLEPDFIEIQEDVERLETAEVVVNLTYADGSPFTQNDTSADPIEVEFGPADEELYVLEMEHLEDGRWNASVELDFEHEPLGDYTWRVREADDRHGRQGQENTISRTVSPIVEIVGARPLIDFKTFVADEEVNGTERSRTVHVSLNAEFKNGVPLTQENVDPSLGGVQLNIKKNNEFGRTLDVDSHIMTPASDDGDWVRSFHISKSATDAPIGTWELEVVARDDKDPPNENVTGFDFPVEPAQIQISPRETPPSLVDEDVENVHYRFELTYPDGTHVTERQLETSDGGFLTVQLERVRGIGQDPAIEEVIDPRSRAGGQFWDVTVESNRLVAGNHYFNVTGEDIHGNTIGPEAGRLFTVLFQGELRNSTTPICPPDESLCDIERGSDVYAVFPGSEGDRGMETEEPEILILRQPPDSEEWLIHAGDLRIPAGEFENRTDTQGVGDNHIGFFQTTESTPLGTYQFFISGRASDDTGFAGFSEPFNITAVTTTRQIVDGLPATAEKAELMSAAIQRQSGDIITNIVAEAGRVTSRAVTATPAGDRMFFSWTPPKTTPSGPASIRVEGQDVFGNTFETTLGPVQLVPMDVNTDVASHPSTEVRRGFAATMEVELTFEDGTTMRPVHGEPSVIVRNAQGERVDEGSTLFTQDRWQLSWRPPPDTPTGRYVLEVTGRDDAGNLIETLESRAFQVIPGRVLPEETEVPDRVSRGELVTATFELDTDVRELNASVTTGPDDLGRAVIQQTDNRTFQASFPTDRQTSLVEAFVQIEGEDEHGNAIEGETQPFQIDPMQLNVRFLTSPSIEPSREDPIVAEFVIEYPDGTRMHPGQGTALVGLFQGGEPQGLIDAVEARPDDPTVWRIEWEPPEDIVTDVPYTFAASAIDQHQNEAPPESTRGFYITNPVIPDYMPVPGPGPLLMLLGLLCALGLSFIHRRRQHP